MNNNLLEPYLSENEQNLLNSSSYQKEILNELIKLFRQLRLIPDENYYEILNADYTGYKKYLEVMNNWEEMESDEHIENLESKEFRLYDCYAYTNCLFDENIKPYIGNTHEGNLLPKLPIPISKVQIIFSVLCKFLVEHPEVIKKQQYFVQPKDKQKAFYEQKKKEQELGFSFLSSSEIIQMYENLLKKYKVY